MGNEFGDVLGRYGRSNVDCPPRRIAEGAKQLNGLLTATAGGYVSAGEAGSNRSTLAKAIRDLRGQSLDQASVHAITAAKQAGTAPLTEQLEG